jgi:uncharacterized protein YcbK (DUF882 family)
MGNLWHNRTPAMAHRRMALAAVCHVLSRRAVVCGLAATLVGSGAGTARANIVRRLTVLRPASEEAGYDVPFWWNGAPDKNGLAKLDWLMRDVNARQVRPIDLRIYYLLALVQAEFGGQPILITSGYRTQATNDRLRQQGIDAARNSFHLHGQAADIKIPGVSPPRIAAVGSILGIGGVGVYPGFVHLDIGPQRFWRG